MPWVYDYDETINVYGTAKNKKLVFFGNSSGKAELIYEAPKHWVIGYTQDEFIELCNAGLQSQMTVGALITLNNTYCDTYEVIGVNHDGTSGTVDIMSHTQVGNMSYANAGASYRTSNIRSYLTETFFQAFDASIQNLAKTMTVATDGGTVEDKVKALGTGEINSGWGSEGSVYEAFANASGTPSLRWRKAGSYGNSSYYWLRTVYTGYEDYRVCIQSSGSPNYAYINNSLGVTATLRF